MGGSLLQPDTSPALSAWATKTISELGTIIGGSTPRRSVARYWGGDIPWVTPGELTGLKTKYLESTRERITAAGLESCGASLLPTDALLVTSRATLGSVALVRQPTATNQGFKSIVFRPGFNPSFYFHLFHRITGELERRASGTTFLEVSGREFGAVRVAVPPFPEQRRIAEILDTLDDVIRKTEQIIAKLKQVKRGLLHDLLTRGINDNGELRDPERHPEQFKHTPLGRIPREWKVARLGDVADVDRGKFTHRPRNDPAFYNGAYPFIQTGDIAAARGRVLQTASQTLNERGAAVSREFPAGTIAITIAANIADTTILGVPMYFPDSVVGAIVRRPNNTRFTELCIQQAKRTLDARAPQSAQKNINLQDLRPLPIPNPSPEEQGRIAEYYNAGLEVLEREETSLLKFRLLKAGIMDDLLMGCVRVTPLLETSAP